MDQHHFDADPDSTYHPDADPDPTFHPDADPDLIQILASKKGSLVRVGIKKPTQKNPNKPT